MTATRASFSPSDFESVGAAVERITRDAWTVLVVRWNWKAAVLSAAIRGLVYAIALARHPEAVLRGAGIELTFRVVVGGCWGSLVQALRNARPAWLAGLVAVVVLPTAAQTMEFAALQLGGATHLKTAMVVSTIFNAGSAMVSFLLMRRGLLLTGAGTATLASDFRGIPRALGDCAHFLSRAVRSGTGVAFHRRSRRYD